MSQRFRANAPLVFVPVPEISQLYERHENKGTIRHGHGHENKRGKELVRRSTQKEDRIFLVELRQRAFFP